MRVKEASRKEIEQRFNEMNEYMKIEYLKTCLNNELDFDTRKFVLTKLAGLYETKGMLLEAGKAIRAAAEINTNLSSKISDYIKSAELFLRGGDFDVSEMVVKKALAIADASTKNNIRKTITEFYKIQAKVCVESNRRKQAVGIYERLLMFDLDLIEKRNVQEVLSKLYGEVGDFNKQRSRQRKISF